MVDDPNLLSERIGNLLTQETPNIQAGITWLEGDQA